jgi:hypothetical protein
MKYIVLLITLSVLMGCANTKVYVLGVDVKEMTKENIGMTVLGAVVSVGTHVAGHYLAAEILDIDIQQKRDREIILYSDQHSKSELAWFARGGFVLQMGVGSALVHLWPDSYFTRGYTVMAGAQVLVYPLRYNEDKGDFAFLEDFEWPLYSGWALHNLYVLNEKNK